MNSLICCVKGPECRNLWSILKILIQIWLIMDILSRMNCMKYVGRDGWRPLFKPCANRIGSGGLPILYLKGKDLKVTPLSNQSFLIIPQNWMKMGYWIFRNPFCRMDLVLDL